MDGSKSKTKKESIELITIPVRKQDGLDPRDHKFLVTLPRCWGESETLDQAIVNAKTNLPETDRESVEGTVYLITPETESKINPRTGAVKLDSDKAEHDHQTGRTIPEREEVNGKEVQVDDEGNNLEFVTNITVSTESNPDPEL